MAIVYIIIIIIFSVILVKSSQWVIRALTYLAKYLHVSEFVAAFILAGVATSLPEIFIGITSAINQMPILSLSNIIGSNIANLTLILGLTIILIKGLSSEAKTIQQNIIYTSILLIYPFLLALDGEISRIDGLGLLVVFLLYNIILIHQSKDFTKKLDRAQKKDLIKNIFIFCLSIILLLGSAHIIVEAANLLASTLNISLFIIGLLLIALGTSLPELVFGIKLGTGEHKDMILGNILGSIAINSTAVVGITALIYPIIIKDISVLIGSAVFLIIVYLLFIIFAQTKKRISWQEAFVLILLYITFVIVQFLLK